MSPRPPPTGCGSSLSQRKHVQQFLSLAGQDVEPDRVSRELGMLLAQDVLAKMDRVGTVPTLSGGLPLRRVMVIFNPHSGNNRAGKVGRRICAPFVTPSVIRRAGVRAVPPPCPPLVPMKV